MSLAWLAALVLVAPIACQQVSKINPSSSWHQKCGWKAEEYFDDPKVVELCRAIESNDIAEIDRLVKLGVNVNAKGKGNMTPLLWSYPDNKLERFKRLLEHGADPNVVIASDFNTRGAMRAGHSVTHMACKTSFPGYFEAVFDHGGDPNLIQNGIISNETPLFTLITGRASNKIDKAKVLIDKGADINHVNGADTTAVRLAAGFGGQYELALALLKAGADYRIYSANDNSRLIHRVVEDESQLSSFSPQHQRAYQELLQWLVKNGESIEVARADMKRWSSWSATTGEYQLKMAEEVAARKAREAKEKDAKQNEMFHRQ
jgi:ankyrin repeat protein